MTPGKSTKKFDVAVIGLGFVGLPLVVEACRSGLRVLGLEVDSSKVQHLLRGESYIADIADAEITEALEAGFHATVDSSELAEAEAHVICVPTPLKDQVPDLSSLIEAGTAVGDHLSGDELVILQSTSYPGTTQDELQPLLERRSGLRAGEDFYLAYAPERIDPGNTSWGLRNTPKLVAGIDPASTNRAVELLGKVCEQVVVVSNPREAEMAKLLENTYRHVNIALMNEMAIFCRELGIDIWEVIRAASTKPFGFQPFYPGPGVGGHCIPVDPNYLSFRVGQLGYPFRFVELAKEINAGMPAYVVRRATELLNERGKAVNGARVVLFGVAYKPDVADIRETPAEPVARKLLALGARLGFVDPHVEKFLVDGVPIERLEPAEDPINGDLGILLTPHGAFEWTELAAEVDILLDTRGLVPADLCERL